MIVIRICTIFLCFLLLLSGLCVSAQDSPYQTPTRAGCPPLEEPLPVIFEAELLEQVGPVIRAEGDILLRRGTIRVTADEAAYNTNTEIAFIRGVRFTTCEGEDPDYHLRAREITLYPHKVHMRKVALYLGNTRIIALPSVKFRVGTGANVARVFPTPGYDDDDGITLSQRFTLIDSDRTQASADIRLTTRGGIQGELEAVYGLDGLLLDLPGRYFDYESLRSRALEFPDEPIEFIQPVEVFCPQYAARTRLFGVVSLKDRAYDIGNEGLVVYRQPEIGIEHTANQINLTGTKLVNQLQLYPQVTATWGRVREEPGIESYTSRAAVSVTVPINFIDLGPRFAIQPIFYGSWAEYGNGESFRTSAYALDVARMFENGTFLNLRYINRNESGTTPFELDDVDIPEEFQAATQLRLNRHVVGFAASYDMDASNFYGWEFMYGYRTDCLAGWFVWNNRIQRFSVGAAIINL